MKKTQATPVKKTTKETKKPEGRNRTAIWRIHKIDVLLRAEKLPSISYLAEKLETSRRSIERDFEFMRERLLLPLEYDQTRAGYYYTHIPPPLPHLEFSEGDLFGFCVMEQMLSIFQGTELEPQLRSNFE